MATLVATKVLDTEVYHFVPWQLCDHVSIQYTGLVKWISEFTLTSEESMKNVNVHVKADSIR